MKKLILALSVMLGLVGTAEALSTIDGGRPYNFVWGQCIIQVASDSTASAAWVLVQPMSGGAYFTGGNYYFQDDVITNTALGAYEITGCLGGASGSVTAFEANGADGTYADDDRIGFSFLYDGYKYTFELVGKTDTKWNETRVQLPAQTLSWSDSVTTGDVGQTGLTVAASNDKPDGGTIVYASSTDDICTVDASSGALTLLKAGTCSVTANAPAVDGKYNAATQITKNVTVALPAQTLSWSDSVTTGDVGQTGLTVAASNDKPDGGTIVYASSPADICTVNASSGALTLLKEGTCSVTANAPAVDGKYSIATEITKEVTVALAAQTLSWSDSVTTGDVGQTGLTVAAGNDKDDGGTIVYASSTDDICTVDASSGALTLLKAGACSVTANAPAVDGKYNAATQITKNVTVALAAQTLSWSDSVTTGDVGQTGLTVAASNDKPDGGTIVYASSTDDICTVDASSGALTLLKAGACSVTANAPAVDGKYNAATQITKNVTVALAAQTLSWSDSVTTGDVGQTGLTVAAGNDKDDGGTIVYASSPADICTVDASSGALTLLKEGTCTVTANAPAVEGKYSIAAEITKNITVHSANLQSAQEIGEAIAEFQLARANALLGHQSDLIDRFTGKGEGSASLNIEGGNAVAAFRSSAGTPVWLELEASRSEDNGDVSTSAFLSVGVDNKVNDNLLVGAMVQVDHAQSDGADQSIKGTGYMVGPYFVAKLPEQELYLEGRALYGQTFNAYTPVGGKMDEFETKRLLASMKLHGEVDAGNGLTYHPFVGVSYTNDTTLEYTNFEGLVISEQEISLMRAEAGLNMRKEITSGAGRMAFTGGISAVHNQSEGTGFASGVVPGFEGTHGRAEIGFESQLNSGHNLTLGLSYDGIGAENYNSINATLGYSVEF